MEWLKIQIVSAPKLAYSVGRALFTIGGFLVVCGLAGRIGVLAVNSARGLGNLPQLVGLADVYPTIPLWWVPEGAVGYAFAAALLAAGIYIALVARAVLKVMGAGQRRRYG